ncbi:MAG: hypothetical protein GX663_01960 [Clostridiales bacterium]|nr:hypothetical protein [Clostridiales bacterium]
MDFLKYMEEIAIPSERGYAYNDMAFDGCYYYFLIPCMCKILKTDLCYGNIDCFETHREYSCICYDFNECCFWATSRKCYNKIFKLNNCLKEIDCINICGYTEAPGIITGISYNCCRDTLLVSFAGCIVEVHKKCEEAVLKYKSCALWITGICCVSPYYIVTAIKDSKQCMIVLDWQNKPLYTASVPWSYNLKSILFNPCLKDCKGYRFDMLANKKGCYPYILHANINPCEINFCPCQCNDGICQKCCEVIPCEPGDACTDVIESIALVEAALSHILNAEGEKLQKVLATTSDINEILCVNKEINKTIINATHLEHALYAKLSAALECCKCDELCSEKCGCDCCNENHICARDVDGGSV